MSDTPPPQVPPAAPTGARPRLFYGWVIVGAAMLSSFGQVTFFNPVLGVFVTPLEEQFDWSRAEIALGATFGSIVGALLSPFAGALIDRHGSRWLIAPSVAVMVVLLLGLSRMGELWQFYLLFPLGRALAVGVVAAAAVVTVSNWFVRRRALAIAVSSIGMRVAMATLPFLVAVSINAGSWRDGFVMLAVVLAIVAIVPPLLLMRRRPEDYGLHPDGDIEVDERSAAFNLALDWSLREAVRTRGYWMLGLAVSLLVFSNGAVNFHQIPHLEGQGLARTSATLLVFVSSMVGIAGALIGGALALRIRPRWTLAISMLGQAVGVLLLLRADSMVDGLVYATWNGLFFGSAVTMVQVIYPDYFGRRELGLIRGAFQPIALTFNAAGPLVAGLWFDGTGTYTGSFLLIFCFLVAGAVALALAPYPVRRHTETANLDREAR